jgi:hypothetical protein
MGSLLLRISKQDGNYKLSWTIIEGDDSVSLAYLVDPGLLQDAAHAVRLQLRVIAFQRGKPEKAEFTKILKHLAQRGRDLFLQLMGPAADAPELRERFERLAKASNKAWLAFEASKKALLDLESLNRMRLDFKVILETDDLFVPWGLVFAARMSDLPAEPKVSLADMGGFWLSHFNISITYSRTKTFPVQRKTSTSKLFALHEVMFTQAKELLKTEDEECLQRLERLIDENMRPAIDWDDFKASWEKVGAQHDSVLYFFGHSNGQRIELRDKTGNDVNDVSKADDPAYDLNASGLIGLRKEAPGDSVAIFLFNGCSTAAPSPDSKEVPISANFLKATCDRGYFGFIGTETQVSNLFACRYGTEFLWRLYQENRSVGQAFDELLQSDKLFPQNLLYSCYADRRFRFVSPASTEKQP